MGPRPRDWNHDGKYDQKDRAIDFRIFQEIMYGDEDQNTGNNYTTVYSTPTSPVSHNNNRKRTKVDAFFDTFAALVFGIIFLALLCAFIY